MIQVYDPRSGQLVVEKVYGGGPLNWLYTHPLGRWLNRAWLQRLASRMAGWYQDSPMSAGAITDFIERYEIRMADYRWPRGGFRSFNDFFIRELAPGARYFPADDDVLGAGAEGRLTVFPLPSVDSVLTVKGKPLSLARLVGDAGLAQRYVGGYAFCFRLCPVDYHRFHFPAAGRAGPPRRVDGQLWSVNPVAHAAVPTVFVDNERQVTELDSDLYGRLLLIEVGATMVGRIIQRYRPGPVACGAQKGWFAFGGSSTLMLAEPGRLTPWEGMLERTAAGTETLIKLGDPIARRIPAA